MVGTEASPGEEGDFVGLDRNPAKEEVGLSRLEFSRKRPLMNPFAESLEFSLLQFS